MCAICGFQNLKENLEEKQNLFREMLETMRCRGKDNTGFYFEKNTMLGHKRLAIVDLENGNQPMYYKEYIIVYNGEIYNTPEVKKALKHIGYTFDTTSDTEVILKGFAEYKEKILDMLEGIFAFCIYNKNTKELFLARDRFGIKPLYYAKKDDNFIFASMIRGILKSKVIKPYLSKVDLGKLLALGPSKPQGSGIFTGINELRPAHFMIVKNGEITIKRYWNVETKECTDTFDEAKEKVKELLTDSIKRQTVSDVPIATLLSRRA